MSRSPWDKNDQQLPHYAAEDHSESNDSKPVILRSSSRNEHDQERPYQQDVVTDQKQRRFYEVLLLLETGYRVRLQPYSQPQDQSRDAYDSGEHGDPSKGKETPDGLRKQQQPSFLHDLAHLSATECLLTSTPA
jgi:hypothetical protein